MIFHGRLDFFPTKSCATFSHAALIVFIWNSSLPRARCDFVPIWFPVLHRPKHCIRALAFERTLSFLLLPDFAWPWQTRWIISAVLILSIKNQHKLTIIAFREQKSQGQLMTVTNHTTIVFRFTISWLSTQTLQTERPLNCNQLTSLKTSLVLERT